jgi:hypothetical protein
MPPPNRVIKKTAVKTMAGVLRIRFIRDGKVISEGEKRSCGMLSANA